MKTWLNLGLLFSFLLALALTFWIDGQLRNQLGDMPMDYRKDGFSLCGEGAVYQNYSVGTAYGGGRFIMREELLGFLGPKAGALAPESGWLTYRLAVNCRGEAAIFQVKGIDSDYRACQFDTLTRSVLWEAVESLEDWRPGKVGDRAVDSYIHITFKIQDGKIAEIL